LLNTHKLAQTIYLSDATYTIGKVYCYFYGPYGYSTAYTIHLDVYNCNDDGTPLNIITSKTLAGSSLSGDDWYYFDVSMSGVTPANGYLSFVIWQENGDEDSYFLWGYANGTSSGSIAFNTSDGATWVVQTGIIRALKVVGSFNAYDLTNFRIVTPPAALKCYTQDLAGGTFDNTELVGGKVIIDDPKLLLSFVVDSSGSMGWNDHFGVRTDMISAIISKFKTYYHSDVLFDIVKFGAQVLDTERIVAGMGRTCTINLDLSTPTRKNYSFTVESVTASPGAIYENNGANFTVIKLLSNGKTLICNGVSDPISAGVLTKVSGTGSATIDFSSYTEATLTNPVMAFGFKNLEDDHVYNLGDIQLDNVSIESPTTVNWRWCVDDGSSISLAINPSGPNSTDTLDFKANGNVVLRKFIYSVDEELEYATMTNDAVVRDTSIVVSDISNFSINQRVDLVDHDFISPYHLVSNVFATTQTLEIDPGAKFDLSSWSNYGGIVQNSSFKKSTIFDGSTLMFLMRDVGTRRNVTFFVQTFDGLMMEWDFQPSNEWYTYNIYWMDESASLSISAFDIDGQPMADGTRVDFYVNGLPDTDTSVLIDADYLTEDSLTGTNTIYIEDVTGYSIGDAINIVNEGNDTQSLTINSVDADTNIIVVDEFLSYDFTVADKSKIIKSATVADMANASAQVSQSTLLSSSLAVVDVTPVVVGNKLSPSLLKPYDPPQVDPLPPTYSRFNLDKAVIRNNIEDVPTQDGKAVVRILPITEDNLKTINEKDEESARLLRLEPNQEYTNQLEQNSSDAQQILYQANTLTTTTTTLLPGSLGYDIDSPVYLSDGYAESLMDSYAIDLEEVEFEGLRMAGISSNNTTLFVKRYEVYPCLTMLSETEAEIAKLYLDKFEVYFTPPINIVGEYVGGNISYTAFSGFSDCSQWIGYQQSGIRGVYAGSGNGFTITYNITDKNVLVNNETLKIKIFSNTVIDIEKSLAAANQAARKEDPDYTLELSRRDINVVLPNKVEVVDGETVVSPQLTDIDTWIAAVEANPASQVIEENDNVSGTQEYTNDVIEDVKSQYTAAGYVSATEDTSTDTSELFTFYSRPWEWTKATQYGTLVETEIAIVNGVATLTVPESDTAALLLIQASLSFGDNDKFDFISSEVVCVGNPINIGAISPEQILTKGEGYLYEIGTNVQWMGNTIADNIEVTFDPPSTQIVPAVSKTDDGWAGGVALGPHSLVEMNVYPSTSECAGYSYGYYEDISVTVSYLGYTRTVERKIEWTGNMPDEELASTFYFYVEDTIGTSAYADGSGSFEIVSDLSDIHNVAWLSPEAITALNGREVQFVGRNPNGSNLMNRFNDYWNGGRVFSTSSGLNQNIGNEQTPPTDDSEDNSPWAIDVSVRTTYTYKLNGVDRTRIGIGISSDSLPIDDKIQKPRAKYKEPLGISVAIESYNSAFTRDGVDAPTIVATVTWKGQPILVPYKNNPTVTFEAGLCEQVNSIPVGDICEMIDTRNTITGCLTVAKDTNIGLQSYSSIVSLSRTDINVAGVNEHTHACEVNSEGLGNTTSTIVLKGVVLAHSHNIANYVTIDTTVVAAHTHNLRSVAITTLNPMTDGTLEVAINGYVVYDPTSCNPYVPDHTTPHPSVFSDGNRMMFSTLYLDGTVRDKEIILTLTPDSLTQFTAEDRLDTDKGFNIVAYAKFSDYTVEVAPGVWVPGPYAGQDVPDGSRLVFEIDAFKAIDAENATDVLVTMPDKVRKYMYVRVKATVYADGISATEQVVILVNSNLQWLPVVKPLLLEPTDDTIYLNSAIALIDDIGSSQINDGVKMASQRIIEYQTNNVAWKSAQKAIILLTDGDENTSQYSIDQAIDNVQFIDGECEVPVIPFRLGYSYGSDEVLLKKYESDTCGTGYYLINSSATDIQNIADDLVTDGGLYVNNGTYTNTIDLGDDNVPSTLSLNNITLPTNSRGLYRYRYGSDNINWSVWSEWIDSTVDTSFGLDINNKARYYQYQVKLFGNENFESPELLVGGYLCYYDYQLFRVFFAPVDVNMNTDEYLSSIHITHKANLPPTSTITYGYSQFNTTDIQDYYSVTRPMITPDRHTIILGRHNEVFLTTDYKTYTAINGGWAKDATIEVYKYSNNINLKELVDSSKYVVNNINGKITFYATQNVNDTFLLRVYFDPLFRIVCNIENYGPVAASIDHIGILYNISKRF